MLYMPTNLLQENMVIACDIPSPYEDTPLLYRDTVLTQSMIDDLDAVGIAGIYIKSDYTTDVLADDCLSMIEHSQSLAFAKHIIYPSAKSTEFDNTINDLLTGIIQNASDSNFIQSNMFNLRCYDSYTYEHSLRVTVLSVLTGIQLKLDNQALWELGVAAMLHDIGKTLIDVAVLNKSSRLTDAEWRSIKKHPEAGCAKAEHFYGYNQRIGEGILHHHEHYDGSGYPYGLAGNAIPLFARIVCCADIYDALTSKRAYRSAWFPYQALDWMSTEGKNQIDPNVFEAFKETVVPYPEGSVVILSTGDLAAVIKIHDDDRWHPVVRTLSAEESVIIDLSTSDIMITGSGYNDKRLLPLIQKGD